MPTPSEIAAYLDTLADLRDTSAAPQRDTYTVAIGQLLRHRLITEEQWRQALRHGDPLSRARSATNRLGEIEV